LVEQPSSSVRDEPEALLAEGVEGARERERNAFDGYTQPHGEPVVLYGAGGLGRQ
jgi:hypothetical protein